MNDSNVLMDFIQVFTIVATAIIAACVLFLSINATTR